MRHQSASLPPNPSLIAILLVTRSSTGPRLVFHYPAVPFTSPPTLVRHAGTATDDSAADGDDWDTSSSEEEVTASGDDEDGNSRAGSGSRGSRVKSGRSRSTRDGLGSGDADEGSMDDDNNGDKRNGKNKKDGQEDVEWEKVLGFSAAGLSHLLSPPKDFNKRKFEVGIEQFVFLGAPMFQRDDGYWKKRRRHRKKESIAVWDSERSPHATNDQDMSGAQVLPPQEKKPWIDSELFNVPGFDAGYGHGAVSNAPSDFGGSGSTSTTPDEKEMAMFNVVFVMNPASLEHHLRVDEMYDFVVKRYAKALKDEQSQRNYVASEARIMTSLKDKAKEQKEHMVTLWPKILDASSLARSIAVVFDAISSNKIAHIDLEGLDMSFQIPAAISTPFAPTATEPQMPGLWLTTATLLDDDESDASLSPNAALLLLEDDDILLKEIESDGKELSGPLSIFIRSLTPTKSLLKLSQRHSMALKDVQFLARHLIYWRRARAIPPLHYRDTYVVSPNADMRALGAAIPAFAARFPMLPPLTKILTMLSGPPRQYRLFMPSPDHRPAYMDILAWLMRGGWVTQLRTFAWIRVSREVKATVAAKQNRESRQSIINVEVAGSTVQHTRDNSETSLLSSPTPQPHRSPDPSSIGHAHPSPLLSPYRYPAGPGSDTGSTSSSRTTVPALSMLSPVQRPESRLLHRPSPLHMNQSASPSEQDGSVLSLSPSTVHRTSHSNTDGDANAPLIDSVNLKSENPVDYEPSLIHSPQRATNEESAWIEYIGSLIPDLFPDNLSPLGNTPNNSLGKKNGVTTPDTGPKARELWPVLLKYFDGRSAMEEISAREGVKKRKVREVWAKLVREGILLSVRHW